MRVSETRLPFLQRLGAETREMVLSGSRTTTLQAGSVIYHPGDPDQAAILDEGMARSYIGDGTGRQTTVWFPRSGDLMGGLLVMHLPAPGWMELLTDATLTYLDLANLRGLVDGNVEVARAMAGVLAERYEHTIETLAIRGFGSVSQRLAFDLLERSRVDGGGALVTCATHQDLADSIGSAREVIGRTLSDLRARKLISTSRAQIRIVDAGGLYELASSGVLSLAENA